ncbi:tetratricopeptide repeat protein [Caballeronia sp. J97]|uniref:tetratricopeptide repeat protein n=1 Tax=Caballeronia sp. J97 TaxID=2805429 RepID=UPI002AB01D47|nr:tetratricopeptide repeat protein [Caballeronia sp. J97]
MRAFEDYYHTAIEQYQDRRFEDALRTLISTLEQFPAEAEALNLAAVCAFNLQRYDDAKAFWQRAIEINPRNTALHVNLGNLLAQLETYEEAHAAFQQASELDDSVSEARFKSALLLAGRQRRHAGDVELRRALALRGDGAEAYLSAGNTFEAQGRPAEAAVCYEHASRLDPESTPAFLQWGNVEMSLERWNRAETAFRAAIERLPDAGWLRFKLGLILQHQHKLDAAEVVYREAIALNPHLAEAHNNLGNLYLRRRSVQDAIGSLREADRLRPHDATVLCNLANALTNLEQPGEAEALYQQALVFDPDHANTKFHLSLMLLGQGRYAEAWPLHEARLDPRLPDQDTFAPDVAYPQWQGESLQGKSIVVLVEQGFGDGIQFSRYFPLVKKRGAATLTVVCSSALTRLFQDLEGVNQCIEARELHRLPAPDFWCFAMSLPLRFQTTVDTIPCEMPYLRPPVREIEGWRRRLPLGKPKVGLVWAGDPRPQAPHLNEVDRRRSVSAQTFLPLLNIPGVTFVSLQKSEESRAQTANLPGHLRPFDPMSDVYDFADTAAIIASLDLVIAVDTSVAHLAGALNKPVWILSRFDACWRWLQDRNDSPWYPSARLFRQKNAGDWNEVIERVAHELLDWTIEHS